MEFGNVNLLAVFLAGLVPMLVGFIWYGPLFGKTWMKLNGYSEEKLNAQKKDMNKTYALSFLGALLMAYVLAHFVNYAGATTPVEGAVGGFWAWLGFAAPIQLSGRLYTEKGFNPNLYVLDTAYYLVSLVVMGAVLVALS